MKNSLHTILILLIIFSNIGCTWDYMVVDDPCDWSVSDGIDPCGENEQCVDDIQIIDLSCIPPGCSTKDQYVINDDSTYKNDLLINYFDTLCHDTLPDSLLPPIDFSKRTLLIANIHDAGGCKMPPIFSYKVVIDTVSKIYVFIPRVQQIGSCYLYMIPILKAISIPKIPESYSVIIKTKYEYCDVEKYI